MTYDIDAIRAKIKKGMQGKFNDPDEFKPAKANGAEPIKYRFYVLPPIQKGEKVKGGKASADMETFAITAAMHWVQNKPHACPRVCSDSECAICKAGFDLLNDEDISKNEEKRKEVIRQFMPNTYYMVNIYFPNVATNPEDLRGKVMYYKAPKTCYDQWVNCLMREDAGDSEEPEAWGAFFDESRAFCYQLEVTKSGKQNSYKTSKFITKDGIGQPIVKSADGKADTSTIAALLASRIDLFTKVDKPDEAKIRQLAKMMIDGDDDPADEASFVEESVQKPQATAGKAKAKVIEEDDSLDDELSEPVKPVETKKEAKKETKKEPKAEVKQPVPDDGSDELDDLLSQLDDE